MIDGNKIAGKIIAELKREKTPNKTLAAILVGSDPASLSFLKEKERVAKELGVSFRLIVLPLETTHAEVEKTIRSLNRDDSVGGILVQLPLPAGFEREKILNLVSPGKDVDALNKKTKKILRPAVATVRRILQELKFSPRDKSAVVVGKGILIGTPVSKWLVEMGARVKTFSKTDFDPAWLKGADLIVTGTGSPRIIRGEMLKPGAIVIDFGYGRLEGKISGDVDFDSVQKAIALVTPTPGGTGPILVAKLFENFFTLNK